MEHRFPAALPADVATTVADLHDVRQVRLIVAEAGEELADCELADHRSVLSIANMHKLIVLVLQDNTKKFCTTSCATKRRDPTEKHQYYQSIGCISAVVRIPLPPPIACPPILALVLRSQTFQAFPFRGCLPVSAKLCYQPMLQYGYRDGLWPGRSIVSRLFKSPLLPRRVSTRTVAVCIFRFLSLAPEAGSSDSNVTAALETWGWGQRATSAWQRREGRPRTAAGNC